jgi:hypothetical protein
MSKYFVALMLPVILASACSGDPEDLCENGVCLPAAERAVALGTACETNFDCSTSLGCRVDRVEHIADGQCTAPCSEDEDCSTFGARSMCIGAGICVAKCSSDGDCPPRTRCGDTGWCERAGAGSGRASCSGTPTPCAMLTGTECSTADGCRDSSSCSGIASDCGSLADLRSCIGQLGCTWSASNTCSGTAKACSAMTFGLQCNDQRGCTWTSTCSGTAATDCSTKSPALCDFTPGCVLTGP